jgi:hypothetical protein
MKKKPATVKPSFQFIRNRLGSVEFVVIPVQNKKMIDLLEDYGLGLAIQEAENNLKPLNRVDAINYLEND